MGRKRRGVLFAGVSFCLGVLIGLGVIALKIYIARSLIGMLGEEAARACTNCSVKADSVKITFLPVRAIAKNVRLVSGQAEKLHFDKVVANFSLARIREHKILITNIELRDGIAYGVGPDSATFKFVDWLAAPLPPERDRPDRYKLKLQRLTVINSGFKENLGDRSLEASQINMSVSRTQTDDFFLEPEIGSLQIRSLNSDAQSLALGQLRSSFLITDDQINFYSAYLQRNSSFVEAKATATLDSARKLSGSLRVGLDAESFGLADFLQCRLGGEGQVSGTLDSPQFSGGVRSDPERPAILSLGAIELEPLTNLSGQFQSSLVPETWLKVNGFSAKGDHSLIELTAPLLVSNQGLSFGAESHFDSAQVGPMAVTNLNGLIKGSGTLASPQIAATFRIGSIGIGPVRLTDLGGLVELRESKVQLSISNQNQDTGKFTLDGQLDLRSTPAKLIRLDLSLTDRSALPGGLGISAKGSMNGPLSVGGLEGELAYTVERNSDPTNSILFGGFVYKTGALTGKITSPDNTLTGAALINFGSSANSKITLSFANAPGSVIFPDVKCLQLAFDADYNFPGSKFELGSGKVNLDRIVFGCAPYSVALAQKQSLPIKAGNLSVAKVRFLGSESQVELDGLASVSTGLSLKVNGSLLLNSLLDLMPSVDDLQGQADLNLTASGPISRPIFSGSVRIADGKLDVESADLSASKINGHLKIDNTKITLAGFGGNLNSGTFSLKGELFPLDLANSSLNLELSNIYYKPTDSTDLAFSGKLDLTRNEQGIPAIIGRIELENGEFRREISIYSIIRVLADAILSRRQAQQFTKLPELNINVDIVAPGNLFVLTSLLGAELRSDLKVAGTLAKPTISGNMETLAGWFGIKERRFEITSGVITFNPNDIEPSLNVISEAYLRAQTGEPITVILEATGLISNPKIHLSSDTGQTQREILNLLTQGASNVGQTRITELGGDLSLSRNWSEDEYSSGSVSKLLRGLTKIDTFTIEPNYSSRRGVVDPTLVATKKLTNSLWLVGQSFFGGSENESSLKMLYALSPKLTLAGILDAANADRNAALGADLTYTILARHVDFIKIELDGNKYLSTTDILDRLRIGTGSRISSSNLERLELNAKALYENNGFLSAQVKANCQVTDFDYCRRLKLAINEGVQSTVSSVVVRGDSLPSFVNQSNLFRVAKRSYATLDLLEKRRRSLLNAVRSEGYISARVGAQYIVGTGDQERVLELDLNLGDPVSFIFRGNKKFSAGDFLETINLFERKQPFGPNTINILIENMERIYREAGYLYVSIGFTRTNDSLTGRVSYLVDVVEEAQARVDQVKLEGGTSLSSNQLKIQLDAIGPDIEAELFHPDYAIAEVLESNAALIKSIYVEEGFPEAEVTYEIAPDDSGKKVSISYIVKEGTEQRADWLELTGLPAEVKQPPTPDSPYSIPKANRYIDELLQSLTDQGYFLVEYSSALDSDQRHLRIQLSPGPRSVIGSINVVGNASVNGQVILDHLGLKSGDYWNTEQLSQAKRSLFRLGLFSRIEFESVDGALDQPIEDLIIKVTERPLTTLEAGGGLNSEYGLHLFGEASDKALFSNGQGISLRVDTYYDSTSANISQGVANLRYTDPELLNTEQIWTEDISFQKQELSTQEFDLNRVTLASYIYRNYQDGLSYSLGHSIFQEDLSNVSTDAVLGPLDEGLVRLGFISGRFGLDRRDYPLNPTKGYNLYFDYQLATQALGSDANFYTLGGRFSFVSPLHFLSRRWSLASSSRAQGGWTFGQTSNIPITERFYLGGRNSVRGFRENSLGPRGLNGAVLGGDLLLANSLELRYLVANNTSVLTFLDAGGVYLQDLGFALDDLRFSSGLGVRYLSPIGPIGLDLGHPLDEQSGEPSVRIHFSIGSNF